MKRKKLEHRMKAMAGTVGTHTEALIAKESNEIKETLPAEGSRA